MVYVLFLDPPMRIRTIFGVLDLASYRNVQSDDASSVNTHGTVEVRLANFDGSGCGNSELTLVKDWRGNPIIGDMVGWKRDCIFVYVTLKKDSNAGEPKHLGFGMYRFYVSDSPLATWNPDDPCILSTRCIKCVQNVDYSIDTTGKRDCGSAMLIDDVKAGASWSPKVCDHDTDTSQESQLIFNRDGITAMQNMPYIRLTAQ
jgi:hypothetical protein